MRNRTIIPLSAAAGLLLAVAVPLAASAHVTVAPNAAEPGSYTVLTVRVPNESATAGTSSVRVDLPTDTPFSSVSYVPVPGWTAVLTRSELPEPVTVNGNEVTEAVTSVTWTADAGSEISDGQLQQFELSVGPVPDTGSIVLPATQTYTDGEVVEWTETSADAEHPAPVLYVNDAPADEHSHGEDADATAADTATTTAPAAGTASSSDVLARVFGIGGLVLSAIALVLAVTARRKAA